MRKIKFRGIPTQRFISNLKSFAYFREMFEYDGTFIYGSLITEKDGRMYIASSCQASHGMLVLNGACTVIEIIPETAGQFIGETDSNDVEIYEGDKIRYTMNYDDEDDGLNDWEEANIVWGGVWNYPAFDLSNHEFETNGISALANETYQYEVIGNIHEIIEPNQQGG